ncbi:MAG: hypothetical protein LBT01_04780 [Spirochaetaceae bacterium]|nr:hypothetical protein [Spirochaetaceae bacterium]
MEETKIADESKITEKDLHFYYNREERLAKASPRVRALYENQGGQRQGFFSSLTDSKPKAALLGVIIIVCVMILFITYLLPENKTNIAGNSITATAMRYNGLCFIVFKKEALKTDAYTGIVTVTVSPAENPPNAETNYNHTLVFTEAKTEEARWSAPFESKELLFFLQAGQDITSFRIKTE